MRKARLSSIDPAAELSRAEREFMADYSVSDDRNQRGVIAAASTCPIPECNSLVIEYRTGGSVRPGHPEDWEFTCANCGVEFTVVQGELLFQTVPKQWLAVDSRAK
jgi:hypothetical protein